MSSESKENLVIVHSFPTNSHLLAGFYEYLRDFFNVYPVDLPGFTPQVSPLNEISFSSFAQFVQSRLCDMPLEHFLLGGVSFGFAVANLASPDPRCKGLLAIEPYLNAQSLHLSERKMVMYRMLLNMAISSKIGETLWGSGFLNRTISHFTQYPLERITMMAEQIDGRTFLETARAILHYQDEPSFHPLPYALIVNPADETVKYDHLVKTFQGAGDLHVVHTRVEHYPIDMTPRYFRERVRTEDIGAMIDWFRFHNLGANSVKD